LTWRRLVVLLRYLPKESAFKSATADERTRWGDVEHLLAGVLDAVQLGNYLTTRAHFQGTPAVPKPILRPGERPAPEVDQQRRGTGNFTREQMAAILAAWRDGRDPEGW
jgi:hypothetical protein